MHKYADTVYDCLIFVDKNIEFHMLHCWYLLYFAVIFVFCHYIISQLC